MNTKDFNFELPEDLIAQFPPETRGNDKLMFLDCSKDFNAGGLCDYMIKDLPSLVAPGTLMIFNDSKVRRARIFGTPIDEIKNIDAKINSNIQNRKECEFLLIQNMGDSVWNVMAKNAKRQKIGKKYQFSPDVTGVIIDGNEEFRKIKFSKPIDDEWLLKYGHIPLPPYIKRGDVSFDGERYQTIYAKNTGSVAAPTAGLHFTEPVLKALKDKGVQIAWVTLHVGLGTFLPVRTDKIEEHKMHCEVYSVPQQTADLVNAAKKEGRPVLAVGTTSIRTLESAWDKEKKCLKSGESSTSIFIYPGYEFSVVDQVFTNFHTPESTLLMLVSAFAGKEKILKAYKSAVEKKYHFFSYGDAMLIKK